ncbi:unnamed protein product [Closterium sp. Naga37s-1]|nr:unnamed protein product [Closterium sp. Naga37s-1]
MANYLIGIVKPISDTSPADASEQQRPPPTTAAEARQQAAENRRQGRDAARAAMGRGTTSHVGSANPGVNTAADAEEDDEHAAEEADAEDAEAPATAEGVQAEAGVDDYDNTPDSGVADGDHTTHVRTGFRQNKRGTRKKLGINLVHWTRLKAPTRRFGIFTSNAAEQVNSSIVPIRRLPVTPMLGGLMDWYRNRYCERKMAALERTDLLTEAAEERMVEKETRAEG